jgi:hypothetical protein
MIFAWKFADIHFGLGGRCNHCPKIIFQNVLKFGKKYFSVQLDILCWLIKFREKKIFLAYVKR